MSVFHEGDGDESGFTCCAFSACERFLMLGTCSGHLKFYNVLSGEEAANYTCHTSAITHLEPSRVSAQAFQHTCCYPAQRFPNICIFHAFFYLRLRSSTGSGTNLH